MILSVVLSQEMKDHIKEEVFAATHIHMHIWDNLDLVEKVDPESSYANYLINPKRALIEDTLYTNLSQDESTNEYRQLIRSVLYQGNLNLDTQLLNSIAKICTPRRLNSGIESIITYNFDDLLERKFSIKEIDFHSIYREDDMAELDKLNIYHVHGYLPLEQDKNVNDSNLIFSEEEYHQVYRDAYSWSNLTQLNAFRNTATPIKVIGLAKAIFYDSTIPLTMF